MDGGSRRAAARPISAGGPDLSQSAYQLTLAGLIFPLAPQLFFNVVGGLSLALMGAPLLAAVWVLGSCVSDAALQSVYRGWLPYAGEVDSARGLRRLSVPIALRSALWMAAPLAFTLATHGAAGIAQTAVTALGLSALAVAAGWTSRLVFAAMAAPAVLAMGIEAAVLLPAMAATAVLMGLASFAGTMSVIAASSHKAVGEWSRSHAKMMEAMAWLQEALGRSEAAERRLRIAIGIADLYVYEIDYAGGTLGTQGDGGAFFERPQTYKRLLADHLDDVHPDDRALVADALDRYQNHGEPYRTEHRLNWSDGREVWAFSGGEIIRDEAGRALRLVGALQNITARKEAERELIQARDAAEAASRAKSEFLATMSHEIRTPLNGVLGMVQVMLREELEPMQRARLDVVRKSGETLLNILNAVLDVAKIESGKLELEDGEVDIGGVARSSLDAFTGLATEKDIALCLQIADDAAGVYRGDPTRVGQILHNLISNAVKFTDQGRVAVTIERRDEGLVLQVSDTGIGIDAAHAASLFDKFIQADASVTRRHGGTGLGLAIARELAVRMGGGIDLHSVRGAGSTFTVTLALPRLTDRAPKSERAADDTPALAGGASALRILAAEDNAINQLVLKTLLHQVGVDPMVVADGEEALVAWQAGEWDLILMDVQMPTMDGPTTARRIRELERACGRAPTPIIALTANVMDHQTAAYLEAGMDGVVAKPIDAARLFEAIEACLAAEESAADGHRASN
jgi:signal transduction histidine kinase